jgi:hypothetical protein
VQPAEKGVTGTSWDLWRRMRHGGQAIQFGPSMPVEEAAKQLRRPAGSVRSMLHRLGIGGQIGREWFTKFSLSRALHTRPDEIQKWIDLGWLKSRSVTTAGTKAKIIHADDFCQFVKEHGRAVVGRRLTYVTHFGSSRTMCFLQATQNYCR